MAFTATELGKWPGLSDAKVRGTDVLLLSVCSLRSECGGKYSGKTRDKFGTELDRAKEEESAPCFLRVYVH